MFKEGAKQGEIEEMGGYTLHRIETRIQAQLAPTAFTTYSFFYNGKFITTKYLVKRNLKNLCKSMFYSFLYHLNKKSSI